MRSVRPSSLAKHAGTPWERRFTYSGEGDLLGVRDSERGVTRHEHDAAHRLVKSQHPDGRVDTYAYHGAGALYESPALGQATIGECNRLRYADGQRWRGTSYVEMGGSGTDVFRSADGTRQFRIDAGLMVGSHRNIGPHVHFERLDPSRRRWSAFEANCVTAHRPRMGSGLT